MIEIATAEAIITDRLLGSPVARSFGLAIERIKRGMFQLTLPFDAGYVTAGTVIHGGVIATMADVTAVATAVSCARHLPDGGPTSKMSISRRRPVAIWSPPDGLCGAARGDMS